MVDDVSKISITNTDELENMKPEKVQNIQLISFTTPTILIWITKVVRDRKIYKHQ